MQLATRSTATDTDAANATAANAVIELANAFHQVANQVAGGSFSAPAAPAFTAGVAAGHFNSTSEWRSLYYAVLAAHPLPEARRVLAITGPLGALRALVHDPDPAVRHAVLDNPFVVDADIQATLAADPEPAIVVGLLQRISPSRQVVDTVLAGPHPEARRTLARMRIGSHRLKALADDDDLLTRCIARSRLDVRGELTSGTDRGERS
jgi:hypothetical protein